MAVIARVVVWISVVARVHRPVLAMAPCQAVDRACWPHWVAPTAATPTVHGNRHRRLPCTAPLRARPVAPVRRDPTPWPRPAVARPCVDRQRHRRLPDRPEAAW